MKAFDPPTHFDTTQGPTIPDDAALNGVNLAGNILQPPPTILYKTTAFVSTTDRLLVIDTRSGRVSALAPPDGTAEPFASDGFVGEDPTTPPLLATVKGRELVLAAFAVKVPGKGTMPSTMALDLVAVDAASGRLVSHIAATLDSQFNGAYLSNLSTAVVGVSGQIAVARILGLGSEAETFTFDLSNGTVPWTQIGFAASDVTGSIVVGALASDTSGYYDLVGATVENGHKVWSLSGKMDVLNVFPSGPSLLVAISSDSPGGHAKLQLIDPRTGAVRQSTDGDFGGVRCSFDGATLTICSESSAFVHWAAAFDTTTLSWLWNLPDEESGRVAPLVRSVWHGNVYGSTENGPVILDGRTGKDKVTDPGAAPYVVDQYVGIAPGPGAEGLRAYPANG
ncbi:hypothetical protein I6A60_07585 [Frankia sp. AgB1.9]|uniref:hypothetical protein n=1 Tax=unclassified Frankia TaxID=2632575 RepID=UPI001933392B|nr:MULTISPECIES: hypothetical protein [unclassified Frankia]MBL7490723.1 hypothetical protein [Frankia sp. AgW1.1]MBL7547733.1 hypothetical protein [Frankia sp. AgB1.9]MBL7622626.1 hypothetical protein [Frankia sp. AgB1.8]